MTMFASGSAMAQGIYTCIDGKGRRITSDRPIVECTDRSQQEISPAGTVRRVIGPTLTAQERATQDEKDKAAAEARAQEQEQKRRDRALLSRYPNRQAHDKERGLALTQVDEVIKASAKRGVELAEQRKAINLEMEFYKKDPGKAPPPLKRKLDENDANMAAQKRFVADQDTEKQRVNQRFDEELVKLRQLWSMMGIPTGPAVASTGRTTAKN